MMCPSVSKSVGRARRAPVALAVGVALALGCMAGGRAVADGAPVAAKPGRADGSFETLKKEYDDARDQYMAERRKEAAAAMEAMLAARKKAEQALRDAKTDEAKQAAQKALRQGFPAAKAISPADGPGATFSPRFLAFAVGHPKDPMIVDAFLMALMTSGGPSGKVGTWTPALEALRLHHVEDPELRRAGRLFRVLADARDEAADALLRDVLARNPDRRARGRACQALALGRARAGELGERLQADAALRRNAAVFLGGEKGVARLIADAPAAKREAGELSRTLRETYDDVCPDLSVGKPAPEVLSQDLEGKPVKLSALKGKVVLDFWATWCGPCKEMIPHERAMVGRLKDKPFVLVSISADEEKETLTRFLAREAMPWTHWWTGLEGGILEDWNIEFFPTIYVLDAQGVIRHKDLRGEALEKAVDKLLEESSKTPL